jgi:hypothetical protein
LGCPLGSTVSLGKSGCVSAFPRLATRGRTLPRDGSRRGDSFVPFVASYLSFASFVSSVSFVSSACYASLASAGLTWSLFCFCDVAFACLVVWFHVFWGLFFVASGTVGSYPLSFHFVRGFLAYCIIGLSFRAFGVVAVRY